LIDELLDELIRSRADEDTIHQALRYYLAERLDDPPPSQMRTDLDRLFSDGSTAAGVLTRLEQNPRMLENAALITLSCAWEDGDQDRIRTALDDAKGKMPVIEIGLLALVAMYGLYLWRTKGIKRSERVISRGPDGSLEIREVTEYTGPNEALSAVVNLLVKQPELQEAAAAGTAQPELTGKPSATSAATRDLKGPDGSP
jgi:hypothetical protein